MYLDHRTAQDTSDRETGNKLGPKWESRMGKPVMLCLFASMTWYLPGDVGGRILDFTWQNRSTEEIVSARVVSSFSSHCHAVVGSVVHAKPWKL